MVLKKNTKNNEKRKIALFQIFLLIISIIAVSWMIGGSVKVVSAEDDIAEASCTKAHEGWWVCGIGVECSNGILVTGGDGKQYSCCENCPTPEPPPVVPQAPQTGILDGQRCISHDECKSGFCNNLQGVCESPYGDLFSSKKNEFGFTEIIGFADPAYTWISRLFPKSKDREDIPPLENPQITTGGLSTEQQAIFDKLSDEQQNALERLTAEERTAFYKLDSSKQTSFLTETIASQKIIDTVNKGLNQNQITVVDALSPEDKKAFYELKDDAARDEFLKDKGYHKTGNTLKNRGWSVVGAIVGSFGAAYGYAYLVKTWASDRNSQALMNTALYVALATTAVVTVLAETDVLAGLLEGVGVLGKGKTLSTTGVGLFAAVVVVVAMSIYLLASYQDYSQEIFNYNAQQWQPPTGGEKCKDCDKLRYGCSEYQCYTFGQGCEVVNKGTFDEACVWVNKNDILPPELSPIDEALKPGYKYIPSQAVLPNERGVKIIYNNGCIPPFTNLLLAVETNEPANCKIDTQRRANFTDMIGYMREGTANTYNHTLLIPSSSMPSNASLENIGFSTDNNKDYQFFIRCIDTNGNPTTSNFLMEFCVDNGPDLAAPIIQATSYAKDSYIRFNTTSVPLEVYTNEPADCRWDFQDLNYPQMKNNMTDCSQKIGDYLKQYYYGCKTELTGIKNGQKNNYYIRCKDQPWFETNPEKKHLRNENKQSYIQSLTGTNPLTIDSVLINDKENNVTIKDATDTIKVTLKVRTSKGAEEGKAKCSYLLDQDYIYFYNLGVPEYVKENTQDLWLQEGNYNFSIRCSDFAGNLDYANAIFKVEKDIYSPEITRVYHEQGKLKLITNEPAQCVFSNLNCNYLFEDGAEISNLESLTHYVDWNTEINYYIKCKDKYGNYPLLQNQCSIIVRGSEYTSG